MKFKLPLKYRVKAFFKKLLEYKPVFKKTMDAEINKERIRSSKLISTLNEDYRKDIKYIKRETAEILKKVAKITYEQDYTRPEIYIVQLTFDARLFHDGNMHHQEYIAEDIAHRIKHDIISARFITKAREF